MMQHFILAIAVIAIIAQAVHLKPVVIDFPSADVFVAAVVNHTITAVEQTETMVSNTLMDIPKSEGYAEHRQNLQELKQQIDDFKIPGVCVEKMLPFSHGFNTFLIPYFMLDPSNEHRIVLDMMKANGLEELKVDFESFIKLVQSGEFGRPLEPDSPGYLQLMAKQC